MLTPGDAVVDLGWLSRRVVGLFGTAASVKGLSLTLRLALGVERMRSGEVKIGQVLSDLIGNAIQPTDSGGVVVLVTSAADPRGLGGAEQEDTQRR